MTALAKKRAVRIKQFKTYSIKAAADTYYQGGVVGFDTSAGGLIKAQASTTFMPVGLVADPQNGTNIGSVVVASGGSLTVNLFREVTAIWMANSSAGDAIAIGDVGKFAYVVDDQTVAKTDNTNARSVAGRIWDVDANKGVLVEPRFTAGDGHLTEIDT